MELFQTTEGAPILGTSKLPPLERYDDPRLQQTPVVYLNSLEGGEYNGAVAWGVNNDLPGKMIEQIRRNPLLSAAMEFKSALMYGNGVTPVRRTLVEGKWKDVPCYEYDEVNEFLEENDVNSWFAEQCLDQTVFNNTFTAISLSKSGDKIIELHHLEAYFSRWEEADRESGTIRHHFYSNQWEGGAPTDAIVTQVLPHHYTTRALRYLMGLERDPSASLKPTAERRFVVPVHYPSLGHPYYARAWWQSLSDSGWLDFVHEIPEYKSALLKNVTSLKYHIQLHSNFWQNYYARLGVSTESEKREAQQKFFERMDGFLSNNKNTGLSFISEKFREGNQQMDSISITPIKNDFVPGGELLADLEEVSNILAYGMGVHPSLIGASPGKNKSINGTEARELFIIKQSLLTPTRERILRPLYLIKKYNNWPADLYFKVANLELTTLDKNTGARRVISQSALEE